MSCINCRLHDIYGTWWSWPVDPIDPLIHDDEFCFTKFDEYAQVFISLFCFINQLYLYQADDHALKFKEGSMNIWLKFKFSFHADQ